LCDELLLAAEQSEASLPAEVFNSDDDGGAGDDAEYDDDDAEVREDEGKDEQDERRGWSPNILLLSNCDDDLPAGCPTNEA
jgi:hypothetical protein